MGDHEGLIEAWRVNHRVNPRLIEAIDDREGRKCTLSTRGGRNVVRQFTHLHQARLMQLENRARPLSKGLPRFRTYDEPAKPELVAALDASAAAIERWIEGAATGAARMRIFHRGLPTTVAYLIAHEAHHRGNILLTLKQCGHPVPQEVRRGIRDWDRV